MPKAEHHVEALSPECEEYLCKKGMYSIADYKDESDPADIYTTDGDLVVIQLPRDIEAYYLMRLVEHGQEQYAEGLAAAKAAIAALKGNRHMFKPTGNSQIDYLNSIALEVAKKDDGSFGVLGTGEKCYVALASNRVDLLESMGYTIPEALARLGDDWMTSLIASWQYAGNPANYQPSNTN